MSLLNEVKSLLNKYHIDPKKSLGQNFIVDANVLKRMIEYSHLDSDDIILEIGAGLGFLTELMSNRAKEVVGVEVDPKLVEVLHDRLADRRNVKIIRGDILKTPLLGFNKIIANPPYSISSPLLLNILDEEFEVAVLTLQEEFVKRLTAREGSKEYGSLAVKAYLRAKIKYLENIPRSSFYPQPEVVSNIIIIEPRSPPFHVGDEAFFFNLVKMLFTQRNKKTKNALENFISEKRGIRKKEARILVEDFPSLDLKIYELKPKDFGSISNKAQKIIMAKRFFFENTLLYVYPNVYDPSDDTFLIAEYTKKEKCRRVLDMGTGCGLLAILMARNAEEAVAVDINPDAVECTKLNARLNSLSEKIYVCLGDLFNGVNGKFDLILFNPPYLPTMEEDSESELLAKAWNGGSSGRKVIDRFLRDVLNFLEKDGKILMVQSTLSRPEETLRLLENSGFKTRVLADEELDFEKLVVIEAIYEGSQ